jgi:hypothetical protein
MYALYTLQGMPLPQQNYIRRNWWQAQHAEAVYAVARILW